MCEKPLAPTVKEGYRIKEMVKQSHVIFYQSFPQRLIPSNIKIKQLLESEAIGKITHIQTVFGSLRRDDIQETKHIRGAALNG